MRHAASAFIVASLLAAAANAQSPREQPVPETMVSSGRLTLPTGGQVAAPDSTWEWRMVVVGETKTFVLAKIGDSARIFVLHQPGIHLNDTFMRGFVDGTLRRSAKQGIQVAEPTFARVNDPVAGAYRFEAKTTLANGASFARVGYVLPSGHIVMMSFQGAAEPPAIKSVAASVKADVERAK